MDGLRVVLANSSSLVANFADELDAVFSARVRDALDAGADSSAVGPNGDWGVVGPKPTFPVRHKGNTGRFGFGLSVLLQLCQLALVIFAGFLAHSRILVLAYPSAP